MSTWKDESTDWQDNFVKSLADERYNEGNLISDSKDPVWSMDETSHKTVTQNHSPCGYWSSNPKDPGAHLPPPRYADPIVVPIVYGRGIDIAWTKNVGGKYGRFVVVTFDNGGVLVSDDGGYTWLSRPTGTNAGSGIQIIYEEGYFIAVFGKQVLKSSDGLTWEILFDGTASRYYPSSIAYNKAFNVIVLTLSQGGATTVVGYSHFNSTWLNWRSVGQFCQYSGNCYYDGYHYIIANNYYSCYRSIDLDNWDLYTFPVPAYGHELISTDSHMIYHRNVYKDSWVSTGQDLRYIFYKKPYGCIGTFGYDIYLSANGLQWEWRLEKTSSDQRFGCCFGANRYIVVGNHTFDIGLKIS